MLNWIRAGNKNLCFKIKLKFKLKLEKIGNFVTLITFCILKFVQIDFKIGIICCEFGGDGAVCWLN